MSNLNYTRFSSKSMKARLGWVQKTLGIPVTYKRDKITVKAILKFQKENGLAGNGMICPQTFELLYEYGGHKYDIDER